MLGAIYMVPFFVLSTIQIASNLYQKLFNRAVRKITRHETRINTEDRPMPASLDKLPTEILLRVAQYLPPHDRASLSMACKRMSAIIIPADEVGDGGSSDRQASRDVILAILNEGPPKDAVECRRSVLIGWKRCVPERLYLSMWIRSGEDGAVSRDMELAAPYCWCLSPQICPELRNRIFRAARGDAIALYDLPDELWEHACQSERLSKPIPGHEHQRRYKARVCGGRLLIRHDRWYILDSRQRISLQLVKLRFGHGMCGRERSGLIAIIGCAVYHEYCPRGTPSTSRRCRAMFHCRYCRTDFKVSARLFKSKVTVQVTSWQDLGPQENAHKAHRGTLVLPKATWVRVCDRGKVVYRRLPERFHKQESDEQPTDTRLFAVADLHTRPVVHRSVWDLVVQDFYSLNEECPRPWLWNTPDGAFADVRDL